MPWGVLELLPDECELLPNKATNQTRHAQGGGARERGQHGKTDCKARPGGDERGGEQDLAKVVPTALMASVRHLSWKNGH